VTARSAAFAERGSREWLEKFYSLNDNWQAEDHRKLLAFARDVLNSDYAALRLTFVQFARAPHFNHLNAVYDAFDSRPFRPGGGRVMGPVTPRW